MIFVAKLEKIEDVKTFVNLASKCKENVYVGQDQFKVSGKSIMGVFSLDLSKQLVIETTDTGLYADMIKHHILMEDVNGNKKS